jgi:hypothetical protein
MGDIRHFFQPDNLTVLDVIGPAPVAWQGYGQGAVLALLHDLPIRVFNT